MPPRESITESVERTTEEDKIKPTVAGPARDGIDSIHTSIPGPHKQEEDQV